MHTKENLEKHMDKKPQHKIKEKIHGIIKF